MESNNSSIYTCLTCKVLFQNSENQRDHYKQDWHKYNLKRKVAGLPSITEPEFEEKIRKKLEEDENANKVETWNCEVCKKVFNTENAYKNHELSKKHMDNVVIFENKKATMNDDSSDLSEDENGNLKEPKINWKKRFAEAQTDEEFNKILDEKIKLSRKLEETECIFCDFKGETFEKKMEHMTVEHTFFIPDVEYLASVKGLMTYLGEKISIGNTCIYCEKMFQSLEAVRKHMLAKGHTKISYEDGPDLEISNFYDFSVLDDDDDMEIENGESNNSNSHALAITSEGTELILPSGVHVGHRDYKKYYNQNLRERDHSNSMALMPLDEKYEALGYYEKGSSGMTIEKERLEKMKNARVQLKNYSKKKQTMGEKTNDFYVPWGRRGNFKRVFIR
ncbi:C2H2 type zinc-finger-domain-containing protein [Neocallimastix sp. 'constans']|jgi:pre-60S factor REI1